MDVDADDDDDDVDGMWKNPYKMWKNTRRLKNIL